METYNLSPITFFLCKYINEKLVLKNFNILTVMTVIGGVSQPAPRVFCPSTILLDYRTLKYNSYILL